MNPTPSDSPTDDSNNVKAIRLEGAGVWKSILAMLIFGSLLPPLGYRPTENDVILNAIVFAAGASLAYSTIKIVAT